MDITVLELHLSDAEFNSPFSGSTDRTDGGRTAPEPAVDESDGGGVSAVAAIAVLVALAALAWYLRSGGDGGMEADQDYPERAA